MKKLIKWGIVLLIVIGIGFGIYKVFFACEKVYTHFDREFELKTLDQASVDSEAIVKLMGVDDNRCKGDDCEHEGEKVAKVLVINNHRFSYVKIGTLEEILIKNLDKMDYSLELIGISDDDTVTLKLIKNN